jgi:putative multiple sugar transport system permease protein
MSDISAQNRGLKSLVKTNLRNYSMVLMLGLIMVIFGFLTGGDNFSARNFSNLFTQKSYIFLLAVGMLMVIVIGNIDLSVGSVCAFTGAISAMLYNTGMGMPLTIILSLAVGFAIGAFQGLWVAYLKVPAFIVTLAGMLLFRGLTYIITNVTPVSLKDDGFKQIASGTLNIPGFSHVFTYMAKDPDTKLLKVAHLEIFFTAILVGALLFGLYLASELLSRRKKIANHFEVSPGPAFATKLAVIGVLVMGLSYQFAAYRGIPTVVIVLGVTITVFTFVMQNTVLGRYIYAVGGNAKSAKLSGINSEFVTFLVHAIMGAICGLAGLVFAGYMNSALPQAGDLFELDAIAACFIGGASTSGGIGTIPGAIIGGLVMAAINNGMSLMMLGEEWQKVVKGSVLLFAVFYDIYTRRKAGLG